MKTIPLITLFAAALLAAPPLRAEDPKPEMKCACMKEHEGKMKEMEQKMQAKMKAESAELDKLVNEMNASIGDKKIEAMAAIINRMAQAHKAMHEKMAAAAPKPAPPAKQQEEVKKADDPHAEHKH